jgi:hypothetical protein
MSDKPDDPLDRLFVDGEDLDRERLAATIFPFARIYKTEDRLEIRFTAAGDKLTAGDRLLVYLLARKALFLRDRENFPIEDAPPKTIQEETGIPANTVRPTLKRLSDQRLIQASQAGGYKVPNHKLNEVSAMLLNKGDKA